MSLNSQAAARLLRTPIAAFLGSARNDFLQPVERAAQMNRMLVVSTWTKSWSGASATLWRH